jgi:hypothetical protein
MKRIATICVLCCFCSAPVFANDVITSLDTNKDEMISAEEAQIMPSLAKRFETLDTNKDGMLDSEEIKMSYKEQKETSGS